MRKIILVCLALIAAGVVFVPLIMIAAYFALAAHAEPPGAALAAARVPAPGAERPVVQPRVRTLESPLVWVATVDRESVKLREADTALLGGESFLTGKSLAEPDVRVWIPVDRVRLLAEFASREDLEEFDDDDVLTKDDAQHKVEMIEINEAPDAGSEPAPCDNDDSNS